MRLPVAWTDAAEADFDAIVEYLERNWSHRVAEHFMAELHNVLGFIQTHPFMYPQSRFSAARYCVMKNHNVLFYSIEEHRILVLSIFDSRQDPAKRTY